MGTLLLLCAVGALFICPSDAGSAGREFVMSFMTNYDNNKAKLELYVTAVQAQTKVIVEVPPLKFRQEKTVNIGESVTFTVPPQCELGLGVKSRNSVLIHATADVTVTAYNFKFKTADTSVVYPITEWGTEYFTFTPTKYNKKEFSVTNGGKPNRVQIVPTNRVTFNRRNYNRNQKIVINLQPYESVLLWSNSVLTDSVVTSTLPVAVFTGHACTSVFSYYCNHVFEQLLPVNKWGSEFFVPQLSFQRNYDSVYLQASQPTKVTVTAGTTKRVLSLKRGVVQHQQNTKANPLHIKANHGIQVLITFNGFKQGNTIYDTYLMAILPMERFCSAYSLFPRSSFANRALIVAQTNAVDGIRFGGNRKPNIQWKRFPGTAYSWAQMAVNSASTLSSSGPSFGLYSVGVRYMNAYGSPGQCSHAITLSCANAKCSANMVCVMKDNIPTCVPKPKEKSGTCWAMGDPHYHSFDGRRFDFMGTCTYVIAKYCEKDGKLPGFEVLAENENRGSLRVSYVGFVTVKVYGITITVIRSEKGRVRIDNTLSCLPISLNNNKLNLYQSGRSVVIETDFGLTVRYDWNNYLLVTLSEKYAAKTCGLCGNFNGNPKDDFITPAGTPVARAVAFGKSWKVPGMGNNAKCRDNCVGKCDRCENKNLKIWESNTFCGIITQTNGPFGKCHSSVNPKGYLENCKYDICMGGGHRSFFCKALEDYTEACQLAGAQVADWKKITRCPVNCPANSQYEHCGSACPATCSDPNAPSKCKHPCVQTCTCKKGFVLSGNQCVPVAKCGCTYKGRYIQAGESFWDDQSCKKRCTCKPGSRRVTCQNKGCRKGQKCLVIKGIRKCHAVSYSTCQATGDPHYKSFDGRRFDFQGTCVYQLAALCSKNPELEHFEVQVQNEHRNNRVVSYTKLVQVKVFSNTLIMTTSHGGKILVNDEVLNLPITLNEGQINVRRSGRYGVLTTSFGLTVSFDWRSAVYVKLPSTYKEAVCGLCGNYNGKHQDDLIPKNGNKLVAPAQFGDSWRVAVIPGCVNGCKRKCPKCDINEKVRYETNNFCGMIRDPSGPFKKCQGRVNPAGPFGNCVFDSCLYKGRKDVLCQAISSYVASCQDAGAEVSNWRSSRFCAMKCPRNSHYEVCADGCPATCKTLVSPQACEANCKEGCVCNDGYILSGHTCVPLSQCGCIYGERYYRLGQVFYPGGKCQEQCKCKNDGEVECKKFKCGPNEKCKIENGIHKCHPVGKGVCQASGDPHYTSYDGKKFDFQGICTYTLSKSCLTKGTNLVEFSVNVENVKWNKLKRKVVSVTKMVSVNVYGFSLTMKNKMQGVLVNGVLHNLPLNLNEGAVQVYKHGKRYVIKTDFGLIVAYDLIYHVRVTVPGNYRGKVCGLCGNFNGNKNDDFKNPRGAVVRNVNSFGASWNVRVPKAKCQHGCVNANCPNCVKARKDVFSRYIYCGIITSPKSPFKICHGKVNPKPYFDDCVYDVCAANGDGKVLCDSIETYAHNCHKAGVDIKNWRTPSFCPLKCPVNSHFEECAIPWASSCPGLSDIAQYPAGCTEGCDCNDGFLFNGQTCVKVNECGCYDNGKTYKPGEVVYEDNCETKTICKPDQGLVSTPHTCPKNTKCMVRKGILACYHTDPCHDANCRVKEKCKIQNGEAVCVPLYTGTCWGWGDPHYRTFDKYSFDFQGNCKYVMSETCGNLNGLVPFSITERNDNRGSTRVSYVREVHVKVYGHTITVRKNQNGHVRVNGELLNLPVELDDGKVRVVRRGNAASVETDFGLIVSYEWKWHLIVKLPSSYHNSVCGLCGNFNGNRNDDRKNPAGKLLSSVIAWGKSWQTPDQDKGSPCYVCEKNCPKCSARQRKTYQGTKSCGGITDIRGLFKVCHKKVDPIPFMESCVYDVCLNNGDKKLLCQALASYTSQCNDNGIKIHGWRTRFGCPMDCPRHSHFVSCASPCQPSCPFPDQLVPCTRNCVESCVCDKGYALSGGVCVPRTMCGCSYQGRYYNAGDRFWDDEACTRLCECDTALGMVKCQEASCSQKEKCTLVDGKRACTPASYSTCTASGDPHYSSFDGRKFDFQGTCEYQLAGLCSKQSRLEPFKVNVQNDHRGSKSVSYTKTVKLTVYGVTITMSRQHPKQVLFNGQLSLLPLDYNNKLKVSLSGRTGVVETVAGITVTFDWQSTVRVTLPSSYEGQVCGLCGNYNGKAQDDFLMKNGKPAPNAVKLGESWQVGLTPSCSSTCKGTKCQTCSDKQKKKFQDDKYCGIIANKAGPYSNCHKVVDPAPFLKNCIFDACQYRGLQRSICDAIQTYVSACQNKGITIKSWRRRNFCPMACPANSHYTLCGSACPTTCSSISSVDACHRACVEGCECNEGFMLSGDKCVPVSDCGCSYEGRYYKKGAVFYPDSKCGEKCVCGGTGTVSCQKTRCRPKESCKLLNGVQGCHPTEYGKCVASGDPHYTSFDGRKFDFQGMCAYVLAKPCDLDKGYLTGFTVTQGNRKYGNGKVAVTKFITVDVYNHAITIQQGMPWKVLVNDELLNLPLSLNNGRLQVTQEGRNIIVRTDFGLKVLYNTVYYVEVIVPSTYQGRMCGLCGNYNKNPRDDFLLSNRRQTRDVDAFGKSWVVDHPADKCGGCGKNCPVCPKAKNALYNKPQSCGIISAPNGPFKACHGKINPKPYLSDCIFDLCAVNGKQETLCNGVLAYALACQGAGVQIKPWRSKSFCPASCPRNSHYELCGRTCGATCAALAHQFVCSEKCFEGCQCDDGFVFDGNQCVPMEKCGCVFAGRYLKVGQELLCNKCKSKCVCHESGLVKCQQMSCANGEVCGVRDGVRGCYVKQSKCTISKNGLLTSFDGMSGMISYKGAFELASRCDESSKKWFRVVVDARVCSRGASPAVSTVYVFYDDNAVIAVNREHVTWVNGKKVSLPSKTENGVSLMTSQGTVIIDIPSVVRVTYSTSEEVTVIPDSSLANKLCGACGNNNDDPKDDMKTANGKVTKKVSEVAGSWSAGDFSKCGL